MSLSVGIVAEGVTDQLVIQNILLGFFKDRLAEQDIYFDQPPDISAEGRFGNWAMVMTYLQQGRYAEVFQLRDYLVVQIDSDVSPLKHFDVSHTDPITGKTLKDEELVARIRDRLCEWIGADDLKRYAGRFLFAICVHELECWLVPLWENERYHHATTNCARRVQQAQHRTKAKRPINKNEPRTYDEASRELRKMKVLKKAGSLQASLGLFLQGLAKIR
jgi:hypothetical protein